MTGELIRYETSGGVATLELHNQPANAYSYDMFRQLDDAILLPAEQSFACGRRDQARGQSGREQSIEAGLALERELQQQLFTSEDAREGLRAFVESRPPSFRGR